MGIYRDDGNGFVGLRGATVGGEKVQKYLDVECYACGYHVLRSYLEGTPMGIVLGFSCSRCGGKVRPIAPTSDWERKYGWG